MDLPWDKLDVTTFSWQKVLGGEAAHGMIILAHALLHGSKATHRMATAQNLPPDQRRQTDRWHLSGATINTPSMLAVEDYLQR